MELATVFVVACIQVSFSQLAFAHRHPESPSKFSCWCNCGEDVGPAERRGAEDCTNAPEEVVEEVVVEDVPELVLESSEEESKEENPVTEEVTVDSAEGSTTRATTSNDADQGPFLRKLSKPDRCVCKHRRTCMCCTCCDTYVEESTDYEVDYVGGHFDECDEERHSSPHLDCVKERVRYRFRPLIYLGYGFDYLLYPPMAYRHFMPCCHFKTRHH